MGTGATELCFSTARELADLICRRRVSARELMAAHLAQAARAHGRNADAWKERATHELITLLRDDYPTLMSVLGALSDVSV